jgi:E3 ubiquitin-protein ligase RNF14
VFDTVDADIIECVNDSERTTLQKLIRLSLVPKIPDGNKFFIIDVPKDCRLELRSLPPLELFMLLPDKYPSNSGPLFMMPNTQYSNALFYEQLRNFLYERLIEKWSEDSIILYECVYYIQEELIPAFLDSDSFSQKNSRFHRNSQGHIEIKYTSSNEFQKVFDSSVEAQRRSFNMEEHQCKICFRKLLGDKFFFLSGCEHYFCLECIVSMVTLNFKNGEIAKICCAESSCKK